MRIFGSIGVGPFRFGASGRLPRWRRPPRRWTHLGCTIQHRSKGAALRCPNGRKSA